MSIVNFFFLGYFDPPHGSHLGFVHTFLVIFSGVSRRNILINFIEIAHTARTYYSKVRNRPTYSKQNIFKFCFYCTSIFQARIIDDTLCLSHIATILY